MKLIREYINFTDLDIITEDVGEGQKSYYLKGPFLEADVKNRNGRKYTKKTLIREVESFNKTKIITNRSMGELDHPSCCLDSDFQVLTKNGWLDFDMLKVGDVILSMDENSIIEEQPIDKIINEPYVGHGYHVKSRNIDSAFTPTHRMLIEDRHGVHKYVTIEEIYNNRTKYEEYTIVKTKIGDDVFTEDDIIHLDSRFMDIQKVEHDSNVYCLSVENSNFCMKQNNKYFWTGNSPSINLDRVSHLITDLKMEDAIGIGCAKVLDTPMGKIAKTLIESGVKLGMSTRGVGTMLGEVVGDDFSLITVDIVADPSAPSAFVEGIMEGIEYVYGANGELVEAVDSFRKKVESRKSRYRKEDFSREALTFLTAFIDEIKGKK